jgi:hypothetical protein
MDHALPLFHARLRREAFPALSRDLKSSPVVRNQFVASFGASRLQLIACGNFIQPA